LNSLDDNADVIASVVPKRYEITTFGELYAIVCYDRKIMGLKLAEIEFVLYL